jgi:hypothetical protein
VPAAMSPAKLTPSNWAGESLAERRIAAFCHGRDSRENSANAECGVRNAELVSNAECGMRK